MAAMKGRMFTSDEKLSGVAHRDLSRFEDVIRALDLSSSMTLLRR